MVPLHIRMKEKQIVVLEVSKCALPDIAHSYHFSNYRIVDEILPYS